MARYLVDAVVKAEEYGLTDVLLPFLFIFVVVFSVLQNTNILGKDKKNLNVILALVMGLTFVIPHVMDIYPADKDPVEIVNKAIPNISFGIVVLFAFLLVIGVFGAESQSHGGAPFAFIVIASVLVIFYLNETHPETAPLVLVIALFLTIGLTFFRGRASDKAKIVPGWILILAFAYVFIVFLEASGWAELPSWLDWLESSSTQAILIMSIVALGMIGLITRESK
jgi:lysylphosphatidylglycerol synthetase-like protein (DUF2156 family)